MFPTSAERLLYMDRGIERGVVVHGAASDGAPFNLARVVQ